MSKELNVQKRIALAIGQIPSGCFVLTASHAGRASGILASWVQQAAFDPPMITVAVKQGRPIRELIDSSGHFVVNHINENPLSMFRHFAHSFRPDQAAFDGLSTQSDPAGVIIQDCIGYMCCKVAGSFEAGDHLIYLGEVLRADFQDNSRPYVHLRSNGLQY